MKNFFNSIKLTKPKTNWFDHAHDVKLSCKMGQLIPVCCMEAVPTDKFIIAADALIRFAPLVSPVMHRFDVTIHYFFVPLRVMWPGATDGENGFEDYITGSVKGTPSSPPAFPVIITDASIGNVGNLADYLGLPIPPGAATATVSAFPFSAYAMIWNEYYRDQNLQTPINPILAAGDNTGNSDLLQLRRRCWEHDYFTSALPFAQKGAAVSLPIADFEDVVVLRDDTGGPTILTGAPDNQRVLYQASGTPGISPDDLYARTSDLNASAATINDLRRAFQLQKFLELDARAGTRYFEKVFAHFGLKSPDSRLQRPEYITGIKTPIMISEVLNTTGIDGERPQGDMAGHGVAAIRGNYGSYYCQEHGYVMGLMSIMPKTAYQDGIPKHFLKINDPYEMYWPLFANIGEQEVSADEVCAYQGTPVNPFGYVPRYAEYKYTPNRVAGQFRTALDFWHAGRIFDPGTPPVLDSAFVECNPRTDIFAVETGDHIFAHVLNKIKVKRSMPKFGNPGGI